MNAFRLLILAATTGIASHTLAAEPLSPVATPAPQVASTVAPQAWVGPGHKTAVPLSTLDDLWDVQFTRDTRKNVPAVNPPLGGLWDVQFTRSAGEKLTGPATSDGCGGCGMSKAAMAAGQPCTRATK